MNVAETASTFAELIVADATLKEAKSDVEKINLLTQNAKCHCHVYEHSCAFYL